MKYPGQIKWRREKPVKEKFENLFITSKALVDYIDEEHVYDKLGDAGCGGVDPHRSEKFMDLIEKAKQSVKEIAPEFD